MTNSLALVPVFSGTINSQSVQLCDARTLHTFMIVLRDFSDWIKGRIRKFGFINGIDFISISRSPEKGSGNRGASIDYHLTLDMAKELAMVENNPKGREARRYFIDCEKQVLAALSTSYTLPATIAPAQAQHLRELVDLVVASGKQGYPDTWSRLHRKMKTNSYLALRPDQFDEAANYLRGKMDDQSMAALIQKHLPHAVPAIATRNALQSLPFKQSSQTLQLMLVTTANGASTVELLPADALPQIIMQKDGVFTADQALKIAMHANLRMMGETIKIQRSGSLQQIRNSIKELSHYERMELTIDGWSELGTRTAITNELAMA